MNDNRDDQTKTSVFSRQKVLRAAMKYIEIHMRTYTDQHNHVIVVFSEKVEIKKKCYEVRLPILDEMNSFASMRTKT